MSAARKIPRVDDQQFNLFGGVPIEDRRAEIRAALHSGRRFVSGDRREIFVGTVRLE